MGQRRPSAGPRVSRFANRNGSGMVNIDGP